MNNKILHEIKKSFGECKKYLDENNEILKSKILSDVLNMNNDLLTILLNNENLKNYFFKEINGVLVFDKVSFSWVLNSSEFLPNSFTSFKNKIGLIDKNNNYISRNDDVSLAFPYKDCVLEFDSTEETEQRDEVYFNEILCKSDIDTIFENKVLTNAKKYNAQGVSDVNVYKNENLVIKGNNLIAMHSLLPRYEGQIKCMYWDILYNTNNDQVPYNDSFKHSSWLVMMKNRLEIAKRLLNKDSGFLLIQCDKNEDSYLTVLCDELFGRDKHICNISVKSNNISGNKTQHKDKTILKNKDSILVYSMGLNPKITPQYTKKQKWDTHYNLFITKDANGEFKIDKLKDVLVSEGILEVNESIHEDIILKKEFYKFILKNKSNIARKVNSISADLKKLSLENKNKIVVGAEDSNPVYAYNGSRISFLDNAITIINGKECFSQLLGDMWTDIDFQNTQNEGGVSLPSGKKPESLMQRIFEMFTEPGDLVLDAYFGTGTTGAVALKMGRKFIGLEQLNSHYTKSIQRLNNTILGEQSGISKDINWQGGGEFISCELLKQNEAWIDLINKSTESTIDGIYDELLENPFIVNYKVNIDVMKTAEIKGEFRKLSYDDKKKVLIAIIDKNNLYVNFADREDEKLNVSESDIKFSKSFYEV